MAHVLVRCMAWKNQRNSFLEPHLSVFREVAKLAASDEALKKFGVEDWRLGLADERGVDEVVSLLLIGAKPTFMNEWGSLLPKSRTLEQQREVWEFGDDRYRIYGLLEATHVTRVAAMEQDLDMSEADSEESRGMVSDQDSDAEPGTGLGGPIRDNVATFEMWVLNKSIGMDPMIATLNFLQRILKHRVDVFKQIKRKRKEVNNIDDPSTPATLATPIDITHQEDSVTDGGVRAPKARRSILPTILEEADQEPGGGSGGNYETEQTIAGELTEDRPALESPPAIMNAGTSGTTVSVARSSGLRSELKRNASLRKKFKLLNMFNRFFRGQYTALGLRPMQQRYVYRIMRICAKKKGPKTPHHGPGSIHERQTRGSTKVPKGTCQSGSCTRRQRDAVTTEGGNSRTLSQSQNGKTDQPIGANTGCEVGSDSTVAANPGFSQAASPDLL